VSKPRTIPELRGDLESSLTTKSPAPRRASFREFLEKDAQTKIASGPNAGGYRPFSFVGREATLAMVDAIDRVMGSATGKPLTDSTIALAGGAQWGKTILELNLMAYATGCRWLNVGTYLPDDNLALNIVDAKFRPDVVDQVGWFAQLSQLGKAVNKSGKSVNKKNAFVVTDGAHTAVGLFLGLRRVPTSFSLDIVIRDEEDDIPRDKKKFLSGRLTASALRLQIIVGTQRVHGAGQNKVWEDGSQGVRYIGPCSHGAPPPWEGAPRQSGAATIHSEKCFTVEQPPHGWVCPEECWPQICRLAVDGTPKPSDPHLTFEGEFKDDKGGSWNYDPSAHYYYAHPETGAELDATVVAWHHRRPEKLKLRNWSFRMAQIGTAAIDLAQIVAHWTRAVGDAEEMISFCCDRQAMPKSAAQALTPAILERARNVAPFDFGIAPAEGVRVGGLDMGDRCWLLVRHTNPKTGERLAQAAYSIAAGDVVARVQTLAARHRIGCLLIDQRPLVNEARTLALSLNGLAALDRWPRVAEPRTAYLTLPGGLTWDGPRGQWRGLKCAVVRFDKKQLGAGIEQGLDFFDEGGETKFVPVIRSNRFETIDRAVRELLTPAENVIEVVNGKVRETPALLLPRRTPGAPAILETLDAHLLAGSQREKDPKTGELGDYVDGVENHLLLADAYSALAEVLSAGPRYAGGLRSTDGCAWGRSRIVEVVAR